eukprot:5870992-Alexandrium_andersonii.AAC.1
MPTANAGPAASRAAWPQPQPPASGPDAVEVGAAGGLPGQDAPSSGGASPVRAGEIGGGAAHPVALRQGVRV